MARLPAKDLTRRRQMVLNIRLRGVTNAVEMADELRRLSSGEFDVCPRTVQKDLKAVLDGEEHKIPSGRYRKIQLARYERHLRGLDRDLLSEDPEVKERALAFAMRVLARIDRVSGAEEHVKRTEAKVKHSGPHGGPLTIQPVADGVDLPD